MIKLIIPLMAAATAGAVYVLSRRRKFEFEIEMKIEPHDGLDAEGPKED